jgi:hypothetical protein
MDAISSTQNVDQKIKCIRNHFVLLDSDLAQLFQVETKVLNQAAQRNINRFPDEFRFQLNLVEHSDLKSQFVTSKGGVRKLPWVYTEHGIAMISTLLRSELAVKMSIEIIRAFVMLRKQQWLYQGLINRIEELEHFKNETSLTLRQLINEKSIGEERTQGIFFNNQIFDAYAFTSDLIKRAKKSIVLLDNYVDETTLIQLSKRNAGVNCTVYTEKITEQMRLDLEKHNGQYPPVEIRILKNVHDRFLIIDNKELYHLGASLKDLGKRWFAFSRMDGFLEEVLARLD